MYQVPSFNPVCLSYFFVRVIFQPTFTTSLVYLYLNSSVRSLSCSTVAAKFYSSWDECLQTFGLCQPFLNIQTTRDDLATPVAAAATAQVKLCPYDEEEPHIWFRLIEAQFAAAGIRSQKLKYANALASLPKQVLRDILDTLDVCNDSDEPFDYLKTTLLGQF